VRRPQFLPAHRGVGPAGQEGGLHEAHGGGGHRDGEQLHEGVPRRGRRDRRTDATGGDARTFL